MLVGLGKDTFEVSTHALVIASPVAGQHHAHGLVAPSLAEVSSLTGDRPVFVQVTTAEMARAAAKAGAAALLVGSCDSPDLLLALAEIEPLIVIQPGTAPSGADPVRFFTERVAWAVAAGIRQSRIVVEAPVAQVAELASLDHLVMIGTSQAVGVQGTHVQALLDGARFIRTAATSPDHVRATRRTAFTIGELLVRRGVTSPTSVYAGVG